MVALLALGLGLGGWWVLWKRGPLQLQHHPLSIPRAARFVPRQAPLSLYVFSDGEQPVDYARAVAPLGQRDGVTTAVERLRDGVFAAAGLDYHDELAAWLAPEIGLSLFDAPGQQPGSSWLLVLSSKDGEGARRFLQRFWQSRSLAGSGLQISQYRGMGLISGRGALVGRDPLPLATALVQDDLVLIASGRTTLERALDVSQIDTLNESGLQPLRQGVEQLGEGMALLVARAEAFSPWLGFPEGPATEPSGDPLLVATLHPEGRELVVDGVLHAQEFPSLPPLADGGTTTDTLLLKGLGGDSDSLALLRNPAALLAQPWLKPLVQTITSPPGAGPLPLQLAAVDPDVLLVSQSDEGWLLGTSDQTPRPEALDPALAAEGLIQAPLEVDGESVTVWTRLRAKGDGARQGGDQQLQASVAGWWRPKDGVAWWGGNLSLLRDRSTGRSLQERQRQLEELDRPGASLRWVLGEKSATALLQPWGPWNRLTTVAGGPLAKGLHSLSLALQPDDSAMRWTARIQFASPTHG